MFSNVILELKVPENLRFHHYFDCKLVPLKKPDSEFRPIALGTTFVDCLHNLFFHLFLIRDRRGMEGVKQLFVLTRFRTFVESCLRNLFFHLFLIRDRRGWKASNSYWY